MSHKYVGAAVAAALMAASVPARADTDQQNEIAALKAEIAQLENRVDQMEQTQKTADAAPPEPTGAQSRDNAFNPAISAVLGGHYGGYTGKETPLAGFAVGDDGKRAAKGIALDEAEIGLSSNVDDKFAANVIASLSEENGQTNIDLEEAYIRTLGLPGGLGVKMGRFLTPVGYLNEHHEHTDDFADRPLPNRAFLGGAYKDDGVMATWLMPTPFYSEIGTGVFAGDGFPGGDRNGGDVGAWLGYARVGGDIGQNQNWLAGVSALRASPGQRDGNDGNVQFEGDSDLYAASLRYVWDPTGNSEQKEVTLQGEYFWRHEDGTYNDLAAATGAVPFDGNQSGWYAQSVYKFAPQWRVGARYSALTAADVPAGLAGSQLDSGGHDPWNAAIMGDWTNSEFSRVRLQYGYEEPAAGRRDNQFLIQYIVAIGAHPAHTF